jgi:hypothetical protein
MFTQNKTQTETQGASSSTSVSLTLLKKRKREESPAPTTNANDTTQAAPWHYSTLKQDPNLFKALTQLTLTEFDSLCRHVCTDAAWLLRKDLIKDLPSSQDKILAACLLINELSRKSVRTEMACSEGSIYFISQHLCPLVKSYFDCFITPPNPKKIHRPASERQFVLDPQNQMYYTPLFPDEQEKRVRLPETLGRALPESLRKEVLFQIDRNNWRVYLHPGRVDATPENNQALYEKIHQALTYRTQIRETTRLFQQAAPINASAVKKEEGKKNSPMPAKPL